MIELESIGKIRGLDSCIDIPMLKVKLCGETNTRNIVAALESIADEIEREVAERFIELPVDADGVPIHVGDKLRSVYDETFEVCAVSEHYVYWEYGRHWDRASECHHVKPRTLEDVLVDFAAELHSDRTDSFDQRVERCAARYADEIRELIVS